MAFASNSIAQARSRKKLLLGSAAGLAVLVGATAAQAQDIADPRLPGVSSGTIGASVRNPIAITAPEATTGSSILKTIAATAPEALGATVSNPLALSDPTAQTSNYTGPRVTPLPNIVVANPGTPATAVDPNNITGVGQMIIDEGEGYVGLCTGTLINPRTMIFAAHCVNEEAATDYGSNQGGKPIAFGFNANNHIVTLDGEGEPDYSQSALYQWLVAGHQTNKDLAIYNVEYVSYHPGSLEPESAGFLYSDVAVASFDTPAEDIPTWALLFSALTAPDEVTADGTGYHVVIQGYGNNGTGEQGTTGGDFRRRIAENMLGALASLDDFETWLGGRPNGLYQNLYFMDFDDPRRGTGDETPYDFNAFRDNATAHEGITAPGDSGGPLVLDDTFDIPVVIGVLSGGYSSFFSNRPSYSYGAVSFYQPLYLYWDWVAANNPYHYVSAKAGDGDWEDGSHWVSKVDPAYMIIGPDGTLVNGVPTTPGEGVNGTDGKFGQMCLEGPVNGGYAECYDLATDEYTGEFRPIGTDGDGATNDKGYAQVGALAGGTGSADATASAGTAADEEVATLPDPTIDNGLPGATDFVPNNSGPVFDPTGVYYKPRYFDVTLSAAGTTTLSSSVEIDRLTIDGGSTALDITEDGQLVSLMSVTQYSGMVRVDGLLATDGDYFLMSGGLQGSGTIYTPNFTSMAGVIAPGGVGTIGTLDFYGDVGLASGTVYMADLGAAGASDLIAVHAISYDEEEAPTSGTAILGGTLYFSAVQGVTVRDGDTYTVLTAEGGISGTFDETTAISAILTPVVSYSNNAVTVEVEAGDYSDVIDGSSPVQSAYAKLLDQNRGNYDMLADLYGPLDMYDGPSIQAALESWAPRSQALTGSMSMVALDTLAGTITQRTSAFASGAATPGDDTTAFLPFAGNPLGTVMTMTSGYATNVADNGMQMEDHAVSGKASVYLAGGYIDGDSTAGIPSTAAGVTDDFDGWYATAGVEAAVGPGSMIGFAVSYAQLDGSTTVGGQSSKATLYQGTLYGVSNLGGVTFDALFSAGLLDTEASRTAALGGTTYTLHASDNPLTITGQLGLSAPMDMGSVTLTPRASIRYMTVGYSPTAETGGPMALQYDMGKFKSFQGRVGATLSGNGTFRPFISANYVHDFDERPMAFSANFVGGVGAPVGFALNGTDQDWAEVSGGIAYDTPKVRVALSANTTIERNDIENRSYQGSVTFRF
ncbi:autotransporter domain-containing protein [Sphingosinithalassobacter portus]|uniref:autotransporter domain-containing protein n=1 Tax=Stakelama portus TaxID=2676234 RepID=UPI001EFDCD57|nr:autotransporter domain-containing protein [Sphingosinithalassobacter portus]